jgi:serine protease Do
MVKLSDGRELKGVIKGMDEKLDLALIKVSDKGTFPSAELGDSDSLEVGEWVMAIGNPFGLGHTVTGGIVSAKGRVIGNGPYDDFIQTDASINPGNSGGPLFNAEGKVIGINTAIIAGGQGIGFAIPINMAKGIVSQLRDTGKVTRGFLGVQIQGVTPDLAKSFNLDADKGALVSDVVKDSPADKAGIKAGDIILEFNGKHIGEFNELPRLVAAAPVDKKARMVVFRDGKRLELTVSVGKLKEEGEAASAAGSGSENGKLGITVQELTKELAANLGVRDNKGLVITEVKPGSPAEDAGVTPGSTIVEINGVRPDSLEKYSTVIAGLKKGDVVRLLLRKQDGGMVYVAIKTAE